MTLLDTLPGFRRRVRISPAPGSVCAEVEDDYHCMGIRIGHDGTTATAVDAVMPRVPWTTCPGAIDKVRETFLGVTLAAFVMRGEKKENCTHLHDLALLAAAHAADEAVLMYDILVSDPVDCMRRVELRRNGVAVLSWVDAHYTIMEPAALAGLALDKMRSWIDSLDAPQREAARLLQWGAILAHGRTRPMSDQSDAGTIGAGRCYTFQPRRVDSAKRIVAIRDFSNGTSQPLERPL